LSWHQRSLPSETKSETVPPPLRRITEFVVANIEVSAAEHGFDTAESIRLI